MLSFGSLGRAQEDKAETPTNNAQVDELVERFDVAVATSQHDPESALAAFQDILASRLLKECADVASVQRIHLLALKALAQLYRDSSQFLPCIQFRNGICILLPVHKMLVILLSDHALFAVKPTPKR